MKLIRLAPQTDAYKAGFTHKAIFTAADVTATGALNVPMCPTTSTKFLPQGASIRKMQRRLITAFSGGTCSAITAAIGDVASATQYLAAVTVFTGATTGVASLTEAAETTKKTYTSATEQLRVQFNATTGVPTVGELEVYFAFTDDSELSRPR